MIQQDDSFEDIRHSLEGLPYTRSYDFNPEHTLRRHAERLHAEGLIDNPPDAILARGVEERILHRLEQSPTV